MSAEPYHVRVFTSGEELPAMPPGNFMHSPTLFHMVEGAGGMRPLMAVATADDGHVAARMMGVVHRGPRLLPPWLAAHGRVYGEGDYEECDPGEREHLFGLMLRAMTRQFRRWGCLYMEHSALSRKMFGYAALRDCGFIPMGWQQVVNSLHSLDPWRRLSPRTRTRISHALLHGVETRPAATDDEVRRFGRLLRRHHLFKMRRPGIPDALLIALNHDAHARVFVTTYRGLVIGGCVCILTDGCSHLLHLATRRKSFRLLHPDLLTVWGAIHWAWSQHYAHFRFLDAGLPTQRSPLRRFVMRFGGRPVGCYRWFRIFAPWGSDK